MIGFDLFPRKEIVFFFCNQKRNLQSLFRILGMGTRPLSDLTFNLPCIVYFGGHI